MADLLDITPGRIVVRRPDSSIILDSSTRMPAKLGALSLTGVTLEWPITDGEYNEYLPLNQLWRHRMYQTQRVAPQVIAAYPSAVLPQFFWCRARVTNSVVGTVAGVQMPPRSPRGQWVPWIGSILLEHWGTHLIRHINLAVIGGNLVVEKRQSTTYKESTYDLQSSTRSVHLLDLELAWGIFDG